MNDTKYACFEDIIEKIETLDNKDEYDLEKIKAAYALAESSHKGVVRKSGEPYISHPISVALILLELKMDTDTISAALLHDVVEDTDVTLEDISEKFGETVAALVDGVTKIEMVNLSKDISKTPAEDKIQSISLKEEQQNESIRKIICAMAEDIRVIIIKLADRLHNMRTLAPFNDDKRRRISTETMAFYAPIAHRLGMSRIKDEMEDIAIFYLDEFAYKEIRKSLDETREESTKFIEVICEKIREGLRGMNPAPRVEGRVKEVYSLYRKMYVAKKRLDEIHDLHAFRIIVENTSDCYVALGIIHELFTPLPKRLKDYIGAPKANGYRSIHTIVLGSEGLPFEVQIRTREMHRTACYGIAAHWRYKLGECLDELSGEDRFRFIRELVENQKDYGDEISDLFAEVVKVDLSPNDVHVFTPKGEVKVLPRGSTVLDFAYSIHTEIGNRMYGVKVHGKSVSFDYTLKTGDIVDIETTDMPGYGPSRSWLSYAKTIEAKAKIRYWLKHNRKADNVSSGGAFVEGVLARNGLNVNDNDIEAFAKSIKYTSVDDFYAAVGYGGISTEKVSLLLRERFINKPNELNAKRTLKGERAAKEKNVTIKVVAINRGVLDKLNKVIDEISINLVAINLRQIENQKSEMTFIIKISDEDTLEILLSRFSSTAGVIDVRRKSRLI